MGWRGWSWGLAAGVAALDLLSKQWALHALGDGRSAGGPVLGFGLVRNRGVSLGLGASHPAIAGAVAALSVGVLGWWLARSNTTVLRAGLALALGGGLGNLADRGWHGAVTDWIQVAGYPATFNLADVAVRLGALTAVVALWLGGRTSRSHRRQHEGHVLDDSHGREATVALSLVPPAHGAAAVEDEHEGAVRATRSGGSGEGPRTDRSTPQRTDQPSTGGAD